MLGRSYALTTDLFDARRSLAAKVVNGSTAYIKLSATTVELAVRLHYIL